MNEITKEPMNDRTEKTTRICPAQKKLPNMNEFSPGTLDIKKIWEVLKLLEPYQNYSGDLEGMLAVLQTRPKILKTPNEKGQRKKRARNVLIGMSQCCLLEKKGGKVTPVLTDMAKEMLVLGEKDASDAFSKYLLLNAHGLELLDAVAMIRARGESIDLQSIRDELRSRQFVVTENEVNAPKIRQWLEASELVSDDWKINDTALTALIGVGSGFLQVWNGLTRAQRVFAKQAKRLDVSNAGDWLQVRQIKRLCETTHGRGIFPEGKLREKVITPLVSVGMLEVRGTGDGRGGDSGEACVCDALRNLNIELPAEGMSGIPSDLRDKLSTPLSEIFDDLGHSSTNTRGLALELLALRLVRDIGLLPVCFRERTSKTQQAEVDLIAQGVHLHYSRWLIQCKNTASVEVSDIAKEVGMAVVLKAQVILMVTTGSFRRTVQVYANGLATSSNLQAILIDGELLKKYRLSGVAAVIDELQKAAYQVLALKAPQVRDDE
ncbi:restriction endonuclease [Comamonas sp. 17RB]|uniref:restriction endonuclease n=1 Tax=Comamonas sp. 17RB TaxID=3047025 RepID=UPI0024B711C8|nr:restriction endonuclease [Comamonas sp. 17RB]MDI9854293.1 restriction endonuclease [Comamonas sp. 17RB]